MCTVSMDLFPFCSFLVPNACSVMQERKRAMGVWLAQRSTTQSKS